MCLSPKVFSGFSWWKCRPFQNTKYIVVSFSKGCVFNLRIILLPIRIGKLLGDRSNSDGLYDIFEFLHHFSWSTDYIYSSCRSHRPRSHSHANICQPYLISLSCNVQVLLPRIPLLYLSLSICSSMFPSTLLLLSAI